MESGSSVDLRGRQEIWSNTLPLLKDTWVVGKGPGAFALDYPNPPGAETYVDRPHNMYLQMAHQSGNVSALIFVLAMAWFLWRVLKVTADVRRSEESRLRLAAIAAACVGYCLAGLATDSFVGVAPVFWVVWGAGFALLGDKWTRPAT